MNNMTNNDFIQEKMKEFDDIVFYEDGLYNTESGWIIKSDPKKIKELITNIIHESYTRGVEDALERLRNLTKKNEGSNVYKDLWINYDDSVEAIKSLTK